MSDVVSPFAAQIAAEVALSLSGGYKLVASLVVAAASLLVASSVVVWHVSAPADDTQLHPPVAASNKDPLEGAKPGHFASISIDARKGNPDSLKEDQRTREKTDADMGKGGSR